MWPFKESKESDEMRRIRECIESTDRFIEEVREERRPKSYSELLTMRDSFTAELEAERAREELLMESQQRMREMVAQHPQTLLEQQVRELKAEARKLRNRNRNYTEAIEKDYRTMQELDEKWRAQQ